MKKITFLLLFIGLCFISKQNVSAQDDCASAVDITASLTGTCNTVANTAVFGTAASATNACFTGSTEAVWFSFTAPVTGFVDITNTNDPGVPDTQLSIHDGAAGCGALATCVGADDDGGSNFTSFATGVPVTAGNVYYIEWSDRWNNAPGDFDVRVVAPLPVVTPGTVNPTDATVNFDCTGGEYEYGAVGFTLGTGTAFTPGTPITGLTPGTTYEVCGTCNTFGDNAPDCNFFDSQFGTALAGSPAIECVQITTPTSCPTPTAITPVCTADGATVTWTGDPANTGYTVEWGPTGFAPGTGAGLGMTTVTATSATITGLACETAFDIYVQADCGGTPAVVSGVATCTATAVCPEPSCNATAVTITGTCNDFVGGAFNDVSLDPAISCYGDARPAALWFSFTVPSAGVIDITSTEDPTGPDTRVSVYTDGGSGDCNTITCVGQDDDSGGIGTNFSSMVTGIVAAPGEVYYVEWDDRWGAPPTEWDLRFVANAPLSAGTYTASNVLYTTADVAGGTCGGELEYVPAGGAPGTGTTFTGTSITGLMPATAYDVYCTQPVCGYVNSNDPETPGNAPEFLTSFTTLASPTFEIEDPCGCDNALNELTADGTVLFHELVTVTTGVAGQTVEAIAPVGILDASGNPVPGNLTLMEVSPGVYEVEFYHLDAIGFTMPTVLADGVDTGLSLAPPPCMGNCDPALEGIPTLSEWGLISLALLILSLGAIKLGATSLSLSGAGSSSLPLPSTGFRLPFSASILRKAFALTAVLALIGFVICFGIYGAIFMSDMIGVMVAGPIFAYLMHLLYIIETNNKK